MEVRQRRERDCRMFLNSENQIFLKLPQQWLAEKAATAMTGQGRSVCTHNIIHHTEPDTISINLSSACPPHPLLKKKNNISVQSPLTEPSLKPNDQRGGSWELHLVQKCFHTNRSRTCAVVCEHPEKKKRKMVQKKIRLKDFLFSPGGSCGNHLTVGHK